MARLVRQWLAVVAFNAIAVAGRDVSAAPPRHVAPGGAVAPAVGTLAIALTDSSHVSVTGSAPIAGTVCSPHRDLTEGCAETPTRGRHCGDGRLVLPMDGATQSFDLTPGADLPWWLRSALSGEPLWCAAPVPAAVPPAVAPSAQLKRGAVTISAPPGNAVLTLPGGLNPDSGKPNELIWSGWESRLYTAIWKSIGTPANGAPCKLTDQAGTVRPTACTVSLEPQELGSERLHIAYTGDPVTSGSVAFTIGSYSFSAPIHTCVLSPAAHLSNRLMAGADSQTISLNVPNDCARRLVGTQVSLTRDSTLPLEGTLVTRGGELRLTLTRVPSTVSDGTWKVQSGDLHLADLALTVAPSPLTVRSAADSTPQLAIHYDLPNSPTDLDRLQNGQSRAGMAVVTKALGDWDQYIQNTASLVVDHALLEAGKRLSELHQHWNPPLSSTLRKVTCKSRPTTCADLEEKYDPEGDCDLDHRESLQIDQCHRARRPWRVTPYSWGDNVWLKEQQWWRQGEKDGPIFVDDLSQITFAVFQAKPHPFEATVELVDYDPADGSEQVVFRQRVTLAAGARVESVPLPVAKALYIECGHHSVSRGLFAAAQPETDATSDIVANGYTRAVNDEDVLTGNCRIHYSPALALKSLGLPANDVGRDLLKYYGPQEVAVSVRRGEALLPFTFPIDPSVESEVPLQIPADAKNASGLYVVTAGFSGPSMPPVTWRFPPVDPSATTGANLDSFAFHANLRPRGPFGWKFAPIRVFLTMPVSFTGVRFPARSSELTKSSSSSNVQVTKIQAGALLAVEPWNYDTGRNPWPVPVRFVTGMNLYNISEGEFVPSWITGFSVTLPIIDLQKGVTEDQLSSDLALGVFWEADVAERDWLKQGNHLLITFGVNLLSLFGSK